MNKKYLILLIVLSIFINFKNVCALNHDYSDILTDNSNNEVEENNNENTDDYNPYTYDYSYPYSYDKKDVEYVETDGVNYYKNEITGFVAFIDDGQDLLTTDEEKMLLQTLIKATDFGNAGLVTTHTSYSSFRELCQTYYRNLFNTENGSIFVIEMNTRQLGLYSDGENQYIITSSKANSITDNVYRYASRGDYYGCANMAFEQVYVVLNGGKIAEPMRYTSNIFIALTLALFIGFIFVMVKSKIKKASYQEIVKNCDISFVLGEASAVKTGQHKVYRPVSDSSGGGSSGGGGGGGGGGGSFGSHGF